MTNDAQEIESNLTMARFYLLATLCRIRDEGPAIPNEGICGNVNKFVEKAAGSDFTEALYWKIDSERSKLMREWAIELGDKSPDTSFPIPGGVKAFHTASIEGTLWDESCEQGILRWDLLHWMIKRLETTLGYK